MLMLQEKIVPRICCTLLILLLLPLPAWSKEVPLFVIQRSKNKNEVHYQLTVDDRCHIATDKPVDAVWKLLEDSPEKTKPLTAVDRLAYGVVHQKVAENWVTFQVKPLEERRVKATALSHPDTQTCAPVVQVEMQGQWVSLERIYVQTEEGLFKPKVLYVDLFGKSVGASPQPVTERLHP
jgi:uncharacterized protein DUF4833